MFVSSQVSRRILELIFTSQSPESIFSMSSADAAAEAETKGGEAPKNGSNGTNGDATNGTFGDSAKAADEEPVAGSSKSPSKKDLDVVTQAMGYYAAGKRDLLIRDPASAVASLAQACELLGKHYGG